MNADAALAAALFTVDPVGLGGIALRAPAGADRDDWLALLRRLLPKSTPWRRVPLGIHDSALLGGLDLGATLQAGRPVAQPGVLASANGGVLLFPMAERLSAGTVARLSAVLDQQEVVMERDGLALRQVARLGVVALDEGVDDVERLPGSLLDRLAFHLVLQADSQQQAEAVEWQALDVANARKRLQENTYDLTDDGGALHALCAAAQALGVDSLRAPWLALKAARAAAALAGAPQLEEEHIALAARLVLAPRATRYSDPAEMQETMQEKPQAETSPPAQEQPPEPPSKDADTPVPKGDDADTSEHRETTDATPKTAPQSVQELAETVLAATQAAIPAGLLAGLKLGMATRAGALAQGRSGAVRKSQARGRPIGSRRGQPRAGARLNVLETLRAAAPWQGIREMQRLSAKLPCATDIGQLVATPPPRVHVRREDFHVSRFKQKSQTTTVFVVDASGSSALNRLAEAKGAVELLLADCYVRRDQVAVLAFRGKTAELLLPPTRSLARAKRGLAGLPGGGGTPLATALDAARELADQVRRRGETPILVLLTDGRANIARDGSAGRTQATADALAAAGDLRRVGFTALLIDTAPQPQASAQLLATAMGGSYLPLPQAGAQAVSHAVRAALASRPAER